MFVSGAQHGSWVIMYVLQSGLVSSSPYGVVTASLTLFPELYISCLCLTTALRFAPPNPLPTGNHRFILCESVSVLFVHVFCFV